MILNEKFYMLCEMDPCSWQHLCCTDCLGVVAAISTSDVYSHNHC